MTNLENLKKLAEGLGADASKASTNLEALNAIAAALGGAGDAQTNAEAIEDIAQAAPGMMKQDVVWAAGTISPTSGIESLAIPEGVTAIGDGAFQQASALASISLPSTLKSIGTGAFYNSAIVELVIPDGVAEIKNSSFSSCMKLEKVTLGAGVSFIANAAFGGDTALDSVILRKEDGVCELDTGGFVAVFGGSKVYSGTGYIYVPKALIEQYKSANSWKDYSSSFRAIEDYPEICG